MNKPNDQASSTRPNPYLRSKVETASPTRLIVMLYDGAIRYCTLAAEAIKQKKFEAQNKNLVLAQKILWELIGSLNRETGGDLASNLLRIYLHMLTELVQANLYDQHETVERVIVLLRDLRQTWDEVDRITLQSREEHSREANARVGNLVAVAAAPHNIAPIGRTPAASLPAAAPAPASAVKVAPKPGARTIQNPQTIAAVPAPKPRLESINA